MGAIIVSIASTAASAENFVPEDGVKYSFRHDGTELYLNGRPDGNVGLMNAKSAEKQRFEYTLTASGDGYLLQDGNGLYLRKEGGWMTVTTSDESKASVCILTEDGDGLYRIQISGTNYCFAPDDSDLKDGGQVWSDKAMNFKNGKYVIVKSADIQYPFAIAAPASLSIEKEGDTASAKLSFTPSNFNGTVTLTPSAGFSVEPASIEVQDGIKCEVTVSSTAEVGTTGTLQLGYNGQTLATVELTVDPESPSYYIFNKETGYVIGGDETPVLAELNQQASQQFKMIAIEGTNRFYLVQKSTGLYFRNVDSGSGVFAHYCEFGDNPERAEWSRSGDDSEGYTLKNSKQDRILIPTKLDAGAELMCYGVGDSAGNRWTFTAVDDLVIEPVFEIDDDNVVVEQNGMKFKTQARAYNLDGGTVTVTASEGVTVDPMTFEDNFQRVPLTIGTSAKEGTECWVEFHFGDQLMRRVEFTVAPRFDRYVIHLTPQQGDTDLVVSTAADSDQPILTACNPDDLTQQIVVMPTEDNDGTVYLLQEGNYGYLSHKGDGWSTVFGANKGADSKWTLEGLDEDPLNVKIRGSRGLIDCDSYEEGSKLYCNEGKGTWAFVAVGKLEVSVKDIEATGVKVFAENGSIRVIGADDACVTVADLGGRVLASGCVNTVTASAGVYIVRVEQANGNVATLKVIL